MRVSIACRLDSFVVLMTLVNLFPAATVLADDQVGQARPDIGVDGVPSGQARPTADFPVATVRGDETGFRQVTSQRTGRVIQILSEDATAARAFVNGVRRVRTDVSFPASTPVTSTPGDTTHPVWIADDFLRRHGAAFGATNPATQLAAFALIDDDIGMKHVRYRQVYEGVPVFGAEVIVHLGADATVQSSNGRVLPGIDVDTTPTLTKEQAMAWAKQAFADQFKYPNGEVMPPRLVVFSPQRFTEPYTEPTDFHLTWIVTVHKPPHPDQPLVQTFFYDAHTGALLHQLDDLRHGDNPNSVDRRSIDCSRIAVIGFGGCGMDTFHSPPPYYFGCSEGLCPRGPHPFSTPYFGSTDSDDLYDVLGVLHDYIWTTFARSGGNGRGGIGDNQSHGPFFPFSKTAGWSHWDETHDCSTNFVATFNFYSVAFCYETIGIHDLAAHEYGHSIPYFLSFNPDDTFSSMTYAGETGSLQENWADLIGEGFERSQTGSNDWIFMTDPAFGGPLRSISDPPSIPDGIAVPAPADRHNDASFYCGTEDAGGRHSNAGVPNKAAYLTSEGGDFNGCTITGIGIDKMLQIWYRAVAYYYTTDADFNDAYVALNSACADLYSAADCTELTKALQATEMDQPGTCSGIPGEAPACAGVPPAETPTVSAWGLSVMVLLILTVGTIVHGRRAPRSA